jgi:hypothetical protein
MGSRLPTSILKTRRGDEQRRDLVGKHAGRQGTFRAKAELIPRGRGIVPRLTPTPS